jgi:hypothetical protein
MGGKEQGESKFLEVWSHLIWYLGVYWDCGELSSYSDVLLEESTPIQATGMGPGD